MKVLHVVNEPVPGRNGGSVHIEEVDKGLVKLGWDVVTVCPKLEFEDDVEVVNDHYKICRFNVDKFGRRIPFLYFFHLMKVIKEEKPDVILERYVPLGCASFFLPLKIPRVLEVNAPVLEHALARGKIGKRAFWFFDKIRRWIMGRAEGIKAQSLGCVPYKEFHDKVVCLEYGADVRKFRPGNKKGKRDVDVVFTGSFQDWHGVLNFLKRLGDREIPSNVFFHFYGDGPEFGEAENFNAPNILFHGSIDYKEVPKVLSKMDVAIAPFDWKKIRGRGFFFKPIKIYEYMSAGLPVVTFDNPVMREMLDWEDGLPKYWGDFFEVLSLFVGSKRERLKEGRFLRERLISKGWTWTNHCKKLDELLRGVLFYE